MCFQRAIKVEYYWGLYDYKKAKSLITRVVSNAKTTISDDIYNSLGVEDGENDTYIHTYVCVSND